MGNTPFYNLFYLEPGIDTADFLNADELRFKTLDSQLYGIYQLFGNGIIEDNSNNNKSWRVETYSDENKFLKVSISTGKGFVSYKSAETTVAKDVTIPVLPSDSLIVSVWFYAVQNDFTPVSRDVDFIASLTRIEDSINYINVGGIIVDTIDNTITVFENERQIITIFDSLSSIIYKHKHIGGSANPSPIDLQTETINTLSGINIQSLDLNTVTRGKLSASRLPILDHRNLDNVGSLTHAQIDNLLSNYIDYDNGYRLADLSIANRLKTLISLKKSGYEYIDSTQLNTIVYVPGIFPNTNGNTSTGATENFSDKSVPANVLTASIYDTGPWNSGLGISSSVSDSVYSDVKTYSSKRDFETAKSYNETNNMGNFENIKINGTSLDDASGNFTISTPLNFFTIEQPVNNIFSNTSGWNRAVNTISNYANGTVSVDTRLYSYKIFNNPISLSEVSNIGIGFSVGLGTTLSKIGQIYMFLVLGTDNDDPFFTNDISVQFDSGQYYPETGPSKLYLSSPDGTEIGYKIFDDILDSASIGNSSLYKSVSLNDLWPSQFRTSVKGLGFYWSSLKGWNPEKSIDFYLNTPSDSNVNPSPYNYDELQTARKSTASNSTSSIFAWNESLFAGTGKFLFRFDSGNSNTVYNLVQWGATQPDNTTISIETRTDLTSNLFYELSNIDFTTSLSSGYLNTLSNKGRYLDVLFTLSSDATKIFSPQVNELKISYSTVGTGNTKIYNTKFSIFDSNQTGWETEKYYSNNIGFGASYIDNNLLKNKMIIADTNKIGNWIFLRNNNAVSVDFSDVETTYEDGIDTGFMSNYLSPVQIYEKSLTTGFNNPKDFQQLDNGSNIYCDTSNDKVVIFDADGKIIKLIQGNIRLKQKERDFVALAGYFNPDLRKIWIAFSQNISSDILYDAKKIYIIYDGNSIRLDDVRIDQNQTGLFDLINGKSSTIEVTFTNDNLGISLSNSIKNARTKTIRIDSGAVVNDGFEANSVGLGAGNNIVIERKTLNSVNYFNSLNSTVTGILTTSFGLPVTILDPINNLDFNNDDQIPTENLLGPNNQIENVSINIYQGPIYFKNIYNPISVHYSLNKIIIAQPYTDSILAFKDDENLSLAYKVPYSIANFYDDKLGSVYEISEGLLLIGCPSSETQGGKLIKYKVLGGLLETNLFFQDMDVVKALPGPNNDNFYVLLDDILDDGKNTRLKLIDSTGDVISTWGENYEILHPKGMRLISDVDILVSE